MGILYSKRCEPVVEGTVINLSDECIKFIESGKAPKKTTLRSNFPLEEEHRFTRLKALDDLHSSNSGVNFEDFKKMTNDLEASSGFLENQTIKFFKKKLIDCLRENQYCMIKCRETLDEFIDCVDGLRVAQIKSRNNSDLEEKRLAEKLAEKNKCSQRKVYLIDE